MSVVNGGTIRRKPIAALSHLTKRNFLTLFVFSLLLCQISVSQKQATARPSAQPLTQAKIERLAEEAQRGLASGHYQISEEDYHQLLKLGVRSPSIYSNLGVVYMRTGRFDKAIGAFREAKTLAPNVAGVRLNLGLAYFRKHDFKPAAANFADTLVLDPNNAQARYLAGESHFMLDEFADAVAAFEPLASMEPNDLDLLFMLGTSYGMLKRSDDSLRIFRRMVEVGNDTPHLHLLLGKAYLALGENEKAEEELKNAAAGDRVPFAHYYLGVLNRQLSRPELAAAEFEKEILIDPTNAMAARELAEVRLDQADPQSAVAVLEKAIVRNHDAPELFATLGRAYLQTSNQFRAIAVLKKAIALSPDISSYHYQLGRAYLKAGRSVEAHTEMERARTLSAQAPQRKMQALSGDRDTEPTPDGSH